jgi:hypothetical protein
MLSEKNLNEKKKIKERIWKIRNYIQQVDNIKEGMIHFLLSRKNLDDVTRNLWISDLKEFYYSIISAWQMLNSASKGDMKYLNKSKYFLFNARSLLAKIISEIKFFREDLVLNLINEIEDRFEKCWRVFHREFDIISPEKTKTKPFEKVLKVSKSEYHLPCSVCGKVSVEYKIGYGRFDKHKSLVYSGITHSQSLNKNLADKVFPILKEGDIERTHNYMKEYMCYEGIDAYCPECDKIYCWEHYNARVEYDDGFYDCTMGECPDGHRRMIDD